MSPDVSISRHSPGRPRPGVRVLAALLAVALVSLSCSSFSGPGRVTPPAPTVPGGGPTTGPQATTPPGATPMPTSPAPTQPSATVLPSVPNSPFGVMVHFPAAPPADFTPSSCRIAPMSTFSTSGATLLAPALASYPPSL